uniref:Uncharacterized protein n=1 Tax=Lepeophtheirus salmonis TaxID=72036 RepID=A0A0K2UZP7_LEPSM
MPFLIKVCDSDF